MQCFLNLGNIYVDVFNAVVSAMVNWTDEIIHFPSILIAEATKALAAMTASFGDLPFAK